MSRPTVKVINRLRQLNARRIAQQRRPLNRAGALTMTIGRRSIRQSDTESPPGEPPHTQTKRLRTAIQFAVADEGDRVIIGPSADVVGPAGAAHEHGGQFRDETFDKRPFMGPALREAAPRFAGLWSDSLT